MHNKRLTTWKFVTFLLLLIFGLAFTVVWYYHYCFYSCYFHQQLFTNAYHHAHFLHIYFCKKSWLNHQNILGVDFPCFSNNICKNPFCEVIIGFLQQSFSVIKNHFYVFLWRKNFGNRHSCFFLLIIVFRIEHPKPFLQCFIIRYATEKIWEKITP